MGGGGSTTSTGTTYTSNLPAYAEPYFHSLMGRAEKESQRNPADFVYADDRTANAVADTSAAQAATRTAFAGGDPDIDAARLAAGQAGGVSQGLGQFQGANIQSTYNAPSAYTGAQFDPRMIQAASVSTNPFEGADAARYMSPYMQQVVERQKGAAQQAFDEGQGARDQTAISKGAFGGYRNAIQEGVARRGLQTQMGDIQAAGSQAGFQQAQAQFNADQARQLQAGTTTAGYNMAAQAANQQAGMEAQKAAEASRQYGTTLGSQQAQFESTEDLRAAQATDASRIAAAGVRQQGGAMALNQAQMSAGLAESSQKLEQARIAAMAAQGSAQQEFAQKDMDIAYNNFLVQRDFEAQRLQQYSGLLRGVPVSANTTVQQNTSSNPLAQVAGLGSLALGMSRMS
jgi:hypothetical protein